MPLGWLRFGEWGGSAREEVSVAPHDPGPAVEGAAPGVAALFDRSREEGQHAILDLGPAAPGSFEVYRRFARRVRFVDLCPPGECEEALGRAWDSALRFLPGASDEPYDHIFGWDILDRMAPCGHRPLIDRLSGLSRPGARLHLIVRASSEAPRRPLRFTLTSTDRMTYEPVGEPLPERGPILPAEVERLIDPFVVDRAFTLKGGLREYVAILR